MFAHSSESDLSVARGVKDKPPPNRDVLSSIERELRSSQGTPDHVSPNVNPSLPGFSWESTWRTNSRGDDGSDEGQRELAGGMGLEVSRKQDGNVSVRSEWGRR